MTSSPVRGTPAAPGRPLRLAAEASAASPDAADFVPEAARRTALAQTIELTAEVNRERTGGSR